MFLSPSPLLPSSIPSPSALLPSSFLLLSHAPLSILPISLLPFTFPSSSSSSSPLPPSTFQSSIPFPMLLLLILFFTLLSILQFYFHLSSFIPLHALPFYPHKKLIPLNFSCSFLSPTTFTSPIHLQAPTFSRLHVLSLLPVGLWAGHAAVWGEVEANVIGGTVMAKSFVSSPVCWSTLIFNIAWTEKQSMPSLVY